MKKLTDILEKIEYSTESDITELYISDVCNNSKKAGESSLFIAIKGAVHDSHDYAVEAYENGCRIFLLEHEVALPSDAHLILVPDTRTALALASAAIYENPADKLHIIALTGTKGKTTTAYLIYLLLLSFGKNAAYIGSNGIEYDGKHIKTANTTPESCELHKIFSQMLSSGVEYVAMEVSSQALYMKRVHGIKFETVVFTNLSNDDHIGGSEHPSFEHYRDCKRQLFFMHGAKNMVYNADDPHAAYMTNENLALYPVSCKGNGSFNAEEIAPFKENGILGISFKMKTANENYKIKVRSPGSFSAYNAMIAIVCARLCNVGLREGSKRLFDLSVPGRFECIDVLSDRSFIIDYAHNGLSLNSVLTALKDYPHSRLISLFGSVGCRTKSRRSALGKVAAEHCDFAIITSDNPDTEPPMDIIDEIAREFDNLGKDNYIKIADRTEAIRHAVEISRPDDIILLAGKGHEDYQLINGIKEPFNERELLLAYAKENFAKAPII